MPTPRKASSNNAYFTPRTFHFLQELEANNNRDWFLANKHRYESEVKEPFLRFIADFGPHLRKINLHFVADPRPSGGSMLRIYRDIRFSKDKSPYKTWLAAHFFHEDHHDQWQTPMFYLHIALDGCFAAGGLWHPDPVALKKVRDSIVARPTAWKKVAASHLLPEDVGGSRPPKGYAADHPFIEDLKRKDFCASATFNRKQLGDPRFLDEFASACKTMSPLMQFLTVAAGLEW
jgi:uncharacterized protein (TIGR02453 family)